jgi:FkbH-like protein
LKLIEALSVLRRPSTPGAEPFRLHLACGFTPLDLKTFLAAHLRLALDARPVEVTIGLYGNLAADLESAEPRDSSAMAVVIEWADLDARLGLRALGGWRVSALNDILNVARKSLDRLLSSVIRIAAQTPVAVCLPSLPLPPVSFVQRAQADLWQTGLRFALEQFALEAAALPGCRLLNRERLDAISPAGERFDLRTDLATGFPYKGPHASAIAELLASLIVPRAPKKGLITDLDDTLWLGIVGETGVDGIGWTLEKNAQLHGLYQQLLQSLADAGVLLAVASKNEPAIVEQAFGHPELQLSRDAVWPMEISWGRKSEAIGRILQSWNIGPEAVVFIDDSAMEIGEVQQAFPAMECRLFPKSDAGAAWKLFGELRDTFARSTVTEEDRLRLESLRHSSTRAGETPGKSPAATEFLEEAQAVISISTAAAPGDSRPFELINKTNQFNLNGRRLQETEWRRLLEDPQALLMVVGYRDRFGPLGRISVLAGRREGNRGHISVWILSCRAFSRQIEHACLAHLYETSGIDELRFQYQPTDRNGPVREFLAGITGEEPDGEVSLTKDLFRQRCPKLFQRVEAI